MRRLFRILLNALTVLSLLLFVATMLLAVRQRSQPWPAVGWGDARDATRYGFKASHGYAQFLTDSNVRPLPNEAHARGVRMTRGSINEVHTFRLFGIGYMRYHDVGFTADGSLLPGRYGTHTNFFVSLAWLLILTALPPLWLAARLTVQAIRRRGVPPGACPACGYDLRATPGRCPECGTIPAR